jgi:hypothetical protein
LERVGLVRCEGDGRLGADELRGAERRLNLHLGRRGEAERHGRRVVRDDDGVEHLGPAAHAVDDPDDGEGEVADEHGRL